MTVLFLSPVKIGKMLCLIYKVENKILVSLIIHRDYQSEQFLCVAVYSN